MLSPDAEANLAVGLILELSTSEQPMIRSVATLFDIRFTFDSKSPLTL
jgi:hypothetical protein